MDDLALLQGVDLVPAMVAIIGRGGGGVRFPMHPFLVISFESL